MELTNLLFSDYKWLINRKMTYTTTLRGSIRIGLQVAKDRAARLNRDIGSDCYVLVLCTGNMQGRASDCKVLNRVSISLSSN